MQVMKCNGKYGEHIEMTVGRAIALAKRHDRKVLVVFNGTRLIVNKRLSVRHLLRTFNHSMSARSIKYSRSVEGVRARAESAARVQRLKVSSTH